MDVLRQGHFTSVPALTGRGNRVRFEQYSGRDDALPTEAVHRGRWCTKTHGNRKKFAEMKLSWKSIPAAWRLKKNLTVLDCMLHFWVLSQRTPRLPRLPSPLKSVNDTGPGRHDSGPCRCE